jgi:hypothetical protein
VRRISWLRKWGKVLILKGVRGTDMEFWDVVLAIATGGAVLFGLSIVLDIILAVFLAVISD